MNTGICLIFLYWLFRSKKFSFLTSGDLGWDEDTEDIVHELIEKRNQTAHPLKPPVDTIEFRDALRLMKEENEIEDNDETTAYVIYAQCKKRFQI